MPDPEHYTRLERLYLDAPCNELYLPSIRVEEGRAEVRLEVRPAFFHAGHAVHGSVLFKALDDAAFFAANSLVTDVLVVTASFAVDFLRPATSGWLVASGRVLDRSRRRLLAESTLAEHSGRLLARGHGTFVPSRVGLSPAIGYL